MKVKRKSAQGIAKTKVSSCFDIRERRTLAQTLEAANILFEMMRPGVIGKITGTALTDLYNNELSSYLEAVIVNYACSKFPKKAEEFRVVRDGYSQLCIDGKLTNEKNFKKIISIVSPSKGHFVIDGGEFLPHHPSQVKRIWVIIDKNFKITDKPVHHKNCFLEDQIHDWNHHKAMYDIVGISYHGMLRGSKGRLLVEFK